MHNNVVGSDGHNIYTLIIPLRSKGKVGCRRRYNCAYPNNISREQQHGIPTQTGGALIGGPRKLQKWHVFGFSMASAARLLNA